jgi:hypothetical protein
MRWHRIVLQERLGLRLGIAKTETVTIRGNFELLARLVTSAQDLPWDAPGIQVLCHAARGKLAFHAALTLCH